MAGKSKFQISRILDERIKTIATNAEGHEPEFADICEAFIIGFHTSNVSNFVGFTTDIKLYNAAQLILGLVFFKTTPTDEVVISRLSAAKESNKEFASANEDKNRHLFLIYSYDVESKLVVKRIFDSNDGSFLAEQPKLSVLDADKLYNHSAMVKVSFPLKLDILDGTGKLVNKSKLVESMSSIKKSLCAESKKLKLHINGSNYSTNFSLGDKNLTETLYDHLDAPKDVEQQGDYLPQLTKEDKKKLVDKWRNKVKAQHAPFEIQLEHEDLSYDESSDQSKDFYKLKLNLITLVHMTDPVSKSLQSILYSLRQVLSVSCHSLCQRQAINSALRADELKVCNFRPSSLGHFVYAAYVIPSEVGLAQSSDYNYLKSLRKELHRAYLLPLDRPQFRFSQRITSVTMKNSDEETGLLCNVHKDLLDKSGIKSGTRNVIEGTYTYHHYMQDRFNDNGWGCAYRSLQTIISWFKHQGYIYSPDVGAREGGANTTTDQSEPVRRLLAKESRVPTHEEIQKILVDVGDKQPNFVGSQKWIGSQEVCYVLNHLYNLESKFISVSSGSELATKARDLGQHFAAQSTPVMIGGGVLAHAIIGTDFNDKNGDVSYLILDPHYTGAEELASIQKKGWCGWKKNTFWDKNSFYNLCLPQRPVEF